MQMITQVIHARTHTYIHSDSHASPLLDELYADTYMHTYIHSYIRWIGKDGGEDTRVGNLEHTCIHAYIHTFDHAGKGGAGDARVRKLEDELRREQLQHKITLEELNLAKDTLHKYFSPVRVCMYVWMDVYYIYIYMKYFWPVRVCMYV
jgi:hypothetical protein